MIICRHCQGDLTSCDCCSYCGSKVVGMNCTNSSCQAYPTKKSIRAATPINSNVYHNPFNPATTRKDPSTVKIKAASVAPISNVNNGGCCCKRCGSRNEYAEPNQKDGSYFCYECR